jgi:hypothetical protein
MRVGFFEFAFQPTAIPAESSPDPVNLSDQHSAFAVLLVERAAERVFHAFQGARSSH